MILCEGIKKGKGCIIMNSKIEDVLAAAHLNELLRKKENDENKKNTIIWVLAIIGAVTAIAGIAFAVFKYLSPTYLDDDFDDFDDDFDDDFYSDDEVVDLSPNK